MDLGKKRITSCSPNGKEGSQATMKAKMAQQRKKPRHLHPNTCEATQYANTKITIDLATCSSFPFQCRLHPQDLRHHGLQLDALALKRSSMNLERLTKLPLCVKGLLAHEDHLGQAGLTLDKALQLLLELCELLGEVILSSLTPHHPKFCFLFLMAHPKCCHPADLGWHRGSRPCLGMLLLLCWGRPCCLAVVVVLSLAVVVVALGLALGRAFARAVQ
eukprot:6492300-Amphidinium_carterae.2